MGIDEAGRGCVIGPLVICGYLIEEKKSKRLRKLGARDSKLLSAKKREEIAHKLRKFADDFIVLKVPAKDIDRLRTTSNLNRLEIERMRHLIEMLRPHRTIVDALEADEKKFHEKLSAKFNRANIVAENFADKKYPVVGAASILAKVERDAELAKLNEVHDIGSGYTSDPKTISFLKNWAKKNKKFPDFVRQSWITVQIIRREVEQRKIDAYAG